MKGVFENATMTLAQTLIIMTPSAPADTPRKG